MAVYDVLPAYFKAEWMLWAYVEEAMGMLQEGKQDAEVKAVLEACYAAEFKEGYREEATFAHTIKRERKAPAQNLSSSRLRHRTIIRSAYAEPAEASP